MNDELRYHTVEELSQLSLDELQALWELVPIERQKAYKSAYEREVRSAGAGGADDLELVVAQQLLTRYRETGLVPVGSRWARTPSRVQAAAQTNEPPITGETNAPTTMSLPKWLPMAGGLLLVCFIGLFLLRSGGGGSDDTNLTTTPTETATPEVQPTVTPLALEAQDDVITGGDSERAVAYPVNLQVTLPDEQPPRVWVVQRRAVRAAEWHFDSNPDIASFISGMSVRPVIGVPWSEENAMLFDEVSEGTIFTVTMNTGAILRYVYTTRLEVLRSDTSIFRQVSPGLVLVLIGEVDADGLPTARRLVIQGAYPPEQELTREDLLLTASEGVVGDTLPLGDAAITLEDIRQEGEGVIFDLRLESGMNDLSTAGWGVRLIDPGGQAHLPVGGDWETLPRQVGAFSSVSVAVRFASLPDDLPAGTLLVRDGLGQAVQYRFSFTPAVQDAPPEVSPYADVSVQLIAVTSRAGRITTRFRIYNGRYEPLTFMPDDIWLALGYLADPPGPRIPALGLNPFTILPQQAADVTLVWYWSGEPYAALQVGDWRWAVQMGR